MTNLKKSLIFVACIVALLTTLFAFSSCGGEAECEHVLTVIPKVEPTCTKTGLTEGIKCSECGEILLAQEIIEAKHTEETLARVEPTCTETGLTEGKKCSVCGEILLAQEIIEALGHSYENNYTCDKCGYVNITESVGLKFTLDEITDTYTVTGIGTCTDTNIFIPCTYNEKAVTIIGEEAFSGCKNLTSIIFGNSIKNIGNSAFYGCTGLTSVTIGDSVKRIGNSAFEGCTNLTEINLNAVLLNDLSKGNRVFYNAGIEKEGIKVTIGKEVTKIPACLFSPKFSSNSPKITSVIFEEGSMCESIGVSAFEGCTTLTNIVIPNSVVSVESWAFTSCKSLTIYCEAESKPSSWHSSWNYSNRPVVWGHTHAYENGSCICGQAEN